jgi:pilus assembly protein CpaB
MRAISVSVAESVAIVDGLIKPGEFVDVHLTVTSLGNDPRLRNGLSLTLFKGVRVVAINKNTQQGNVEVTGNTVTLELTAEQANILVLAREKGSVTLSYNPEGKGTGVVDVEDENRATLDEILGLQPLPEPEEPFTVEIFRRSGVETLQFDKGRRVSRGNARSDESGVRIQATGDAIGGGRVNSAPARPFTRPASDGRNASAPAIGGSSAEVAQPAGAGS